MPITGLEHVQRETVPSYLAMRLEMGHAARALVVSSFRGTLTEVERSSLGEAAKFLSPDKSSEANSGSGATQLTMGRLLLDTWEAMGVPEHGWDNVPRLLGRATLTLEELSQGEVPSGSDMEFTETFVQSMRDYAASQRTRATDTVLSMP
jgi:hypothetical protein